MTPHQHESENLPDRFLRAAKWTNEASSELREAARQNDAATFCRAWLAQTLTKVAGPQKLPVGMSTWSLYDGMTDPVIVQLTRSLFASFDHGSARGSRATMKSGKSSAKHLEPLVKKLTQQLDRWTPTEAIIASELLLVCGRQTELAQVWALWSRLVTEGLSAREATADETPDQLLIRTGELPFVAGGLLEPLRDAEKRREQGRRALVQELFSHTDRDGTPHAELLPRLPLWLAPLIRATHWATRLNKPLWSEEERQRLSLVLERAIPLCRPNGRLAFSNGLAAPAVPLFAAAAGALELTGPAKTLLATLQQKNPSAAIKKRRGSDVQVMPSMQSDWARFAMLRSDWTTHADSLAISHHQPLPLLDVAALGQPMLHGLWGLDLQIGDAGIELAPEWACSCWMSDPDADYLELQMQGPGGLRVERQVLLSREDHFLLLADCVRGALSVKKSAQKTGADEQRIRLQSRLPLAAGVTVEPAGPTRELRLKAGKQTVRVFPLALPDDRVQSTPHQCFFHEHELVLQQFGVGNGLYVPLIFDWHPERTRKPALWRTLTVTESGKVVGRDIAAGHRLQLGKFQLLFYRSLSPGKTARAVLGHHTFRESVIARFDADGDVETIMHVDP